MHTLTCHGTSSRPDLENFMVATHDPYLMLTDTTENLLTPIIRDVNAADEFMPPEDDIEQWLNLDEQPAGEAEAHAAVSTAMPDDVCSGAGTEALAKTSPSLAKYLSLQLRRQVEGTSTLRFFSDSTVDKVMAGKISLGCWICGRRDHKSAACDLKRCFLCSEQGHSLINCPCSLHFCKVCGSVGHTASSCPKVVYKLALCEHFRSQAEHQNLVSKKTRGRRWTLSKVMLNRQFKSRCRRTGVKILQSTQKRASLHSTVLSRWKQPKVGIVKYFRGSFGWVVSSEASFHHCSNDIFVHISDCNFKPKQWDLVSFELTTDIKGDPKAVQVYPLPGSQHSCHM
mmetsp:Transcript_107272/g.201918  ORF Transcript_107272/g.201918 Transcript_107272/m.201918 type:complete len:341 (+) Transcript_107272:60-1082(+)